MKKAKKPKPKCELAGTATPHIEVEREPWYAEEEQILKDMALEPECQGERAYQSDDESGETPMETITAAGSELYVEEAPENLRMGMGTWLERILPPTQSSGTKTSNEPSNRLTNSRTVTILFAVYAFSTLLYLACMPNAYRFPSMTAGLSRIPGGAGTAAAFQIFKPIFVTSFECMLPLSVFTNVMRLRSKYRSRAHVVVRYALLIMLIPYIYGIPATAVRIWTRKTPESF